MPVNHVAGALGSREEIRGGCKAAPNTAAVRSRLPLLGPAAVRWRSGQFKE
jgi:hypothetical protein